MFCTALEYHALVTLPLLVLSASIYPLLPVALTSLLISLFVCAVAAAQARLPKKKQRAWSRPLVALLFLLQPIVRGWARYNWRLTVRSEPPVFKRAVSREQLDDLESSPEVGSWSGGSVDRYTCLNQGLSKLEREGRPQTGAP